MTVHGQFYWNELMTRDAEKAKAFYRDCIGWTFDEMKMDDSPSYWVAKAGGAPAAGIFTMTGPGFDGVPEHWLPYLHVDDVDAAVSRAEAMGARTLRPVFEVAGIGRIAIIQEPGGAVIGWMTPAKDAK
ncbi:MAG: hypothetical protein Tsb0010_02170 [Parvularculaceae bacterium]